MRKVYLALLMGAMCDGPARTEAALRKNVLRSGERVVRAVANGKAAQTEFEPIGVTELASLARVRPRTGRTHQIRVHAAHLGHPVAGDDKYGDADFNQRMKESGLRRLFLHAERLEFSHPDTGRPQTLRAPLEAALVSVLKDIGLGTAADV